MKKHYTTIELKKFLKNKHFKTQNNTLEVKGHLDNCRECWSIWNRVRWDVAIGSKGVAELKKYLGNDYIEYYDSSWALADEWKSRERTTTLDIEAFYKETNGYVYNSLIFYESGDRESMEADLNQILSDYNISSVIDYGSGVGNDTLIFLKYGIKTFSIDFNSPVSDFLRFRVKERGYEELSELISVGTDKKPTADMIWTIDTLEHMVDPYEIFKYITAETRVFTYFIDADDEAGGRHPFHLKFDYEKFNSELKKMGFNKIKSKKLSSWSRVWSR